MDALLITGVFALACTQRADVAPERVTKLKDRVYVGINFSPDGRFLAVSGEPFVSILATSDFKPAKELKLRGLVDEVVFDPSTKYLVSRGRAVDTSIWDVETWKEIKFRTRPAGSPYTASPELAPFPAAGVENGRTPGPWSGQRWLRFAENPLGSCPAAFSPDGRWMAISNGGMSVRVWEMKSFREKPKDIPEYPDFAEARLEHANALLFHDRYLILGEEDGYVTPLPLEKWEQTPPATPSVTRRDHDAFRRHRDHVTSLSMTPDGEICFTASLDGKVCAWRIEQLAAPRFSRPEWTVAGVYAQISEDGRRLAVVEEKGVRIYDVARRAPEDWIPADPRTGRVVRLRFSPSGTHVAIISCTCEACVPRKGDDVSLGAYKAKAKRVHHHGGALEVWKLKDESPER